MKLIIGLSASQIKLTKDKLKKLDSSIHHSKISFQYVSSEFLNIKLLNINDVKIEELSLLEKNLEDVLSRHNEFSLKLHGMSAYPNTQEARVIWIGVQNSIELRSLQHDIAKIVLNEKDLWEDTLYKPTLPILRFKNHHNVIDMISPYKSADFGKILFTSAVLLEMTKSGAFPEYKIIRHYHLNKREKMLEVSG